MLQSLRCVSAPLRLQESQSPGRKKHYYCWDTMAGQNALIPGSANLSPEECQEQLQRVLRSVTFRNATTSQLLLQFIASKTLTGSADDLKEYTIGVEALGRRPDFDPKTDPIVRVQSHRLRLKLRDYYDDEGVSDPVLIQLSKGRYSTTFDPMVAAASELGKPIPPPEPVLPTVTEPVPQWPLVTPLPTGTLQHSDSESASLVRPQRPKSRVLVLGVAATALLSAAAFYSGERYAESRARVHSSSVAASLARRGQDPVEVFWGRWVGNDPAPVIAYTDAVFLLDDSNDLFRYRRGAIDSRGALVDPHLARDFASNPAIVAQAGHLYYENGYTGTGELEAAATLAVLLGRMGVHPTVKSSRDINPGDLNDHNVILLGSPFQNEAVAQLLTGGDFVYQNPDQRHEQWRGQILNRHPRPGEASVYRTERDPTNQVLKADYGLITVVPGLTSGRRIVILGGLDTKGTEGAALLATSKSGIAKIQSLLATATGQTGTQDGGDMPPFQALVRVSLARGYQVIGADLIAVHPFTAQEPATNPKAVSP